MNLENLATESHGGSWMIWGLQGVRCLPPGKGIASTTGFIHVNPWIAAKSRQEPPLR